MIISENFTLNGVPQTGLTPVLKIFEDGLEENDSVADLAISGASGVNATLGSATSALPTLVVDQLVYISGATNPVNNGLWKITAIITAGDEVTAEKIEGSNPANEVAFAGVIGKYPYNEPMIAYGNGLYYYSFSNSKYSQLKRFTVLFDGTATITVAAERYKSKDIGYHPI